MSIQANQNLAISFATQDRKGVAIDADSLPTGQLVKNGSTTGVTVTVSAISIGQYVASFTVPSNAAPKTTLNWSFQLRSAGGQVKQSYGGAW